MQKRYAKNNNIKRRVIIVRYSDELFDFFRTDLVLFLLQMYLL